MGYDIRTPTRPWPACFSFHRNGGTRGTRTWGARETNEWPEFGKKKKNKKNPEPPPRHCHCLVRDLSPLGEEQTLRIIYCNFFLLSQVVECVHGFVQPGRELGWVGVF
ncbi:uncharacterized protein J3R85_019750 [Psidium guajava]|nr:uncharacterized protein J3R85_019750 [Psidium guajava]